MTTLSLYESGTPANVLERLRARRDAHSEPTAKALVQTGIEYVEQHLDAELVTVNLHFQVNVMRKHPPGPREVGI